MESPVPDDRLPQIGETIEVRERPGSPWRKLVVTADHISTCRWHPELWRTDMGGSLLLKFSDPCGLREVIFTCEALDRGPVYTVCQIVARDGEPVARTAYRLMNIDNYRLWRVQAVLDFANA